MFNGVSTSSTSPILIQVGSSSVSASGYSGAGAYVTTGAASTTSTAGFPIIIGSATEVKSGVITLSLFGSNTWVCSGSVANPTGTSGIMFTSGISPALSGALDRVNITTANGTDTFDAGSINILWE